MPLYRRGAVEIHSLNLEFWKSADFGTLMAILGSVAAVLTLLFGQWSPLGALRRGLLRVLGASSKRGDSSIAETTKPGVWIRRRKLERELLRRISKHQVVLLEGPRGIGKTALVKWAVAHLSAGRMRRKYGPIEWISLKYRTFSSDDVFDAIGLALGLDAVLATSTQHKPVLLGRLLREQRRIIVIDNFESITSGVSVVSDFLANLPPGNRCIVTTAGTAPLIAGAVSQFISGFNVKQVEQVCRQNVKMGYLRSAPRRESIESLCEKTGGVPLAIEWALARSRTGLPVERVISSFEKSGTDLLEDLFQASWQEVGEDGQLLLALAGLFESPVPLDALYACLSEARTRRKIWIEPEHEEAVSALASSRLISLESVAGYDWLVLSLHPLVHSYARQRASSIDVELRKTALRRVTGWYVDFFDMFAEGGDDPVPGLTDHELDNALKVLALCEDDGLTDPFVDLCIAMSGSLLTAGRLKERLKSAVSGASYARTTGRVVESIKLLRAGGTSAVLMGRISSGRDLITESISLAESEGLKSQVARGRRAIAALLYRTGDYRSSRTMLAGCRESALEAGDATAAIDIDYLHANLAYMEGRLDEAELLCDRIMVEAEDADYVRAHAYALEQKALVELDRDQPKAAAQLASQGKEIAASFYDRRQEARCALVLGRALLFLRRPIAAKRYLKLAALTFAEVGLKNEESLARVSLQYCAGVFQIFSTVVLGKPYGWQAGPRLPTGGD